MGSCNNERLEYLGDAVLGFVIAEALYKKFPDADEGQLTRLRSQLVKGERLAEISNELELQSKLNVGPGELKSGGWRRQSVLANTLEAIIGAIYIDSNFLSCKTIILELYKPYLDKIDLSDIKKDAKTELQEYLQSRHINVPDYSVVKESGSSHSPVFQVECKVDTLDKAVFAEGSSKRKAEQAAAKKVLEILLS